MVDARRGPGLELATDAALVTTPEGVLSRVEQRALLRVGAFDGSSDRARVQVQPTGRRALTELPRWTQSQVPVGGLPGRVTPLVLTGDRDERRLAPELVADDRALNDLERTLDQADRPPRRSCARSTPTCRPAPRSSPRAWDRPSRPRRRREASRRWPTCWPALPPARPARRALRRGRRPARRRGLLGPGRPARRGARPVGQRAARPAARAGGARRGPGHGPRGPRRAAGAGRGRSGAGRPAFGGWTRIRGWSRRRVRRWLGRWPRAVGSAAVRPAAPGSSRTAAGAAAERAPSAVGPGRHGHGRRRHGGRHGHRPDPLAAAGSGPRSQCRCPCPPRCPRCPCSRSRRRAFRSAEPWGRLGRSLSTRPALGGAGRPGLVGAASGSCDGSVPSVGPRSDQAARSRRSAGPGASSVLALGHRRWLPRSLPRPPDLRFLSEVGSRVAAWSQVRERCRGRSTSVR
jgi:hypothetical protein